MESDVTTSSNGTPSYVCLPTPMPGIQVLRQLPARSPVQTLRAQPKAEPWPWTLQPPWARLQCTLRPAVPGCYLLTLIRGSMCRGTCTYRYQLRPVHYGIWVCPHSGYGWVQAEEGWLFQGFEFLGQQNIIMIIIILQRKTIINTFLFIMGIDFTILWFSTYNSTMRYILSSYFIDKKVKLREVQYIAQGHTTSKR